MKRTAILLAVVASLGLSAVAMAGQQPGSATQVQPGPDEEAKRLHAFFDAEWERRLRESPMTATYLGDNRANDRWDDMSLDAIAARDAADAKALAKLAAIERGKRPLPPAELRHHALAAAERYRRAEVPAPPHPGQPDGRGTERQRDG